jgi:tetratricopeptide (TPR) repeat protein
VRLRISEAYLNLGALRGDPIDVANLGDREGAVAAYERAWSIGKPLVADNPQDPAVLLVAGRALVRLAGVAPPGSGDADARLREGLTILGGLHERQQAGEPMDASLVQSVVRELGYAHKLVAVRAQDDDAGTCARHAALQLRYFEELARRWPDAQYARFLVADAHLTVAGARGATGDFEAAARGYEAAASVLEELRADDPVNIMLRSHAGWCELQLAKCNEFLDRAPEALAHATRARDVYAALAQEMANPESRQRHVLACWQMGDLETRLAADAADERAHLARAGRAYREALDACTALVDDGHLPPGSDAPLRERAASIAAELAEG